MLLFSQQLINIKQFLRNKLAPPTGKQENTAESRNNHIQEFLKKVCDEVRYKCVRKSIAKELSDHIEDQKSEYMKQGMDKEVATQKAIENMGNPVIVGKQLDKTHRPRTEWSILSIITVLVLLGGVVQFVFSRVDGNTVHMFTRFLQYTPFGIAAFIIAYFFDYTIFGRYSKLVYFLLISTFVANYFLTSRLNRTFIYGYYLAFLFIPAFTAIIYGFKNRGYLGIIFSGLFYTFTLFLCLNLTARFPSFANLLFIFLIGLVILTVAIVKGYFGTNKLVGIFLIYIPTLLISCTAFLTVIVGSGYRYARIKAMFFPWHGDPLGEGFQYQQVKKIIYSAKLIGKTGKDMYLPGWSTDFSLTYIIGNYGHLAGIIIVIAMLALISRMVTSVMKQKNAFGFLLSLSACMVISGQILLYLLSNFAIIGPMPFALPFVSYGASGLIMNMALLGLLLSVYRRTDLVSDKLKDKNISKKMVTLSNGKLIIDLGITFGKNSENKK